MLLKNEDFIILLKLLKTKALNFKILAYKLLNLGYY